MKMNRLYGPGSIHQTLFQREILSNWTDKCLQKRLHTANVIERLDLLHTLEGHQGCVNSVLFSESGEQIITGSDDTTIRIFCSHTGQQVDHFETFHTNNVFYAKDLPNHGSPMEWIISCAADGRVGLLNAVNKSCRLLYRHRGRAHRIGMIAQNPRCFWSAGEDGVACLFDIRIATSSEGADPALKVHFQPRLSSSAHAAIYSVAPHPSRPHELALAGACNKVAIYDIRKPYVATEQHCPGHLRSSSVHVTGSRYSADGHLLLATYNDEDVYTFSTSGDVDEDSQERGYLQRYSGHRNNDTVKQVAFLGGDEFIVSGSDCGHVFIWETASSMLVNVLHADRSGAVNCLSEHPSLPYLAVSGLDSEAKVFAPTGKKMPKHQVDGIIRHNSDRSAGHAGMMTSRSLRAMLRMMLHQQQQVQEDEDSHVGQVRGATAGDEQPTRRRRLGLDEIMQLALQSMQEEDSDEEDQLEDSDEEGSADSDMMDDMDQSMGSDVGSSAEGSGSEEGSDGEVWVDIDDEDDEDEGEDSDEHDEEDVPMVVVALPDGDDEDAVIRPRGRIPRQARSALESDDEDED